MTLVKPILVIAREADLRAAVARLLIADGNRVELADTVKRAREILGRDQVQLTIVAPQRLGADGWALAKDLHATTDQLIAVMEEASGSRHFETPLAGLRTCPGNPLDDAALLAQVRLLLAADMPGRDSNLPVLQSLRFADFTIDVGGHAVRDADGRDVPLTPAEFSLLLAFARSPGQVLSRDQLLSMVAGREADSFDRSIDVLVGRLRRKIEPNPKQPRLIVTMPRVGYKFTVRPARFEEPDGALVKEHSVAADTPRPMERRPVTVLSCEFAAKSFAAADVEELYDCIESLRQRCHAAITRLGGYVANILSNRLVAYFGHPRVDEHDAERAVQAGLAIVHELAKAGVDRSGPMKVRVGIASGVMVIGGVNDNVEQAPVGEPLLVAAALQARAQASVLIDGATRNLIGSLFEYRMVPPVFDGNFDQPVPAWEVLRPSRTESRFEALRRPQPRPMIGREEELEVLQRRWAQACQGQGRAALIAGEPGIGKSRVLAALDETLREEPITRLRYFCSPHHQDTPLFPIIRQLEFSAGFDYADTAAVRLGKLQAVLAATHTPAEDVALIATALQLPVDGLPTLTLSPQRRKERTFSALLRQVEQLSRTRPLLMLFEDAHWADASTREIFDHLIQRLAQLRVLLVMTFRPEFHPPWIGQAGVILMTLGPLDRHDAASLAEQSASNPMSRALLERIVGQADGVPLFIEELTRAVMERIARHASAVTVPTTLQASLLARLDRMPAGKQVAQIGAVIGRDFSHAIVGAVADLPQAVVSEGLDQLVTSGLLFRRGEPPDASYSFKHALVQDVAYESLLRARRLALHAAIGSFLERDADTVAAQPALLGHHFAQAGAVGKAVFYLLRAGEQSAAGSAMAEAHAHLTRGLKLAADITDTPERNLRQAELTLALGNVAMVVHGQGSPAHGAAFAQALEIRRDLAPDQDGFVRLSAGMLNGDWIYKLGAGHLVAARDVAQEFYAFGLAQHDPSIQVMGALAFGTSTAVLGRLDESLRIFSAASSACETEEQEDEAGAFGMDARSLFRSQWSRALVCAGYLDRAAEQARLGVQSARRHGHLPSIAVTLTATCFTALTLRDARLLQAQSAELCQLAQEQGFALWLARGRSYAGWAAGATGQLEQGRALLTEAMAGFEETGMRLYRPEALGLLADIQAWTGRNELALDLLGEALDIASTTGEVWLASDLHRRMGELQGTDPTAAETHFCKALEISRRQSAKLFELRAAISLARLWRKHGRDKEAQGLLEPIYAWFSTDARRLDMTEDDAQPVPLGDRLPLRSVQ